VAAARTKKEKQPPGPDDLVRESAGTYRTGDGRFEIQKSDQGWFLLDSEQTNEFGQQLIHGPLPTLDAVKAAIPGSRDLKPLLRVRSAQQTKKKAAAASKAAPAQRTPPPAPPPSWIDKLSEHDAREVRQLIRALEKDGLDAAELVVRRGRGAATPVIATQVVEHRMRALVDQQPEADRERAHKLIRQVAKILAEDGTSNERPTPRWALVEVAGDDPPAAVRMRPRP
jgi:hypothetical protein